MCVFGGCHVIFIISEQILCASSLESVMTCKSTYGGTPVPFYHNVHPGIRTHEFTTYGSTAPSGGTLIISVHSH